MPGNYPFVGNAQTFLNDFAINNPNPAVEYGGTETTALYYEDREINGAMYRVQNATFNKVAQLWIAVNSTLPCYGTALLANGTTQFLTSPAGTTPFSSWTVVASVDKTGMVTGNLTGNVTGNVSGTVSTLPAAVDMSALGEFNVKKYGAKGDGVTDDSAAITAASNAAGAVSQAVFFPSGTYLCGNLAPVANVSYVGIPGSSVLKSNGTPIFFDATGSAATFKNASFSGLVFDSANNNQGAFLLQKTGYSDIAFWNCTFQNFGVGSGSLNPMVAIGAGSNPSPATRNATTSLRMSMRGCLFKNLDTGTREALLAVAWGDSLIQGCVFTNCKTVAAGILDLYAYCDSCVVSDCVFSGNAISGAGSNGRDIYLVNSTGMVVKGCTFYETAANLSGIAVENCHNTIIDSCEINVPTEAIGVIDTHLTFDTNPNLYENTVGLIIKGCSIKNAANGVHVPSLYDGGTNYNGAQQDVSISGCLFDSVGTYGVLIGGYSYAAQAIKNVQIFDNNVDANYANYGIGVLSGVTNVSVQRNRVSTTSQAAVASIKIDGGFAPVANALVTDNDCLWTTTPLITGLANGVSGAFRNNHGFNPVGKLSSQPAVPATTVAYTNTTGFDCTVYITGGTVTAIATGGQSTGLTSGSFRVPVGQTITLTYSVAPTWVWFGD